MNYYKICIVFRPSKTVEKCLYRYAKDTNHAKNIGNLILKDRYGMKSKGHYVTIKKVK
jgi:hypothetical protein